MKNKILIVCIIVASLSLWLSPGLRAQTVVDLIKANPAFATCNYNTYPDSIKAVYTPAPAGKKPFYFSHYGRHGSRYISSRSGFDIPFKMVAHADSLNELTPTGQRVFQEMKLVMADTEGRWGELTGYGRQQHRAIARRMVLNFPEVFHPGARVQAFSTVVPRQWFMNYQDRELRRQQMTPKIRKAYNEYISKYVGNTRLMELIFKNSDIVGEVVDEGQFNYYLMKMGLFQVHTHLYRNTYLIDIFQTDELYRMWQMYLQQGACKLNGGHQPYSQRHLLRRIIADADSCIRLADPGAQLRYGHETVLLPLVCLIGINGYDLETSDFDELEKKGWWCSRVFPMGANLQFIFYRSDVNDRDVLLKVLLNEEEARLPIPTDCAPYYHWSDFRAYCLDKLDRYKSNE